jgi:prepilin-type N-terminal cleavage/methylation domain-containing protein
MCITPRRHAARPGFTLAELLISIAIILILMALSAAAILRFASTGPQMATQSNLDNLKAALDKQWKAVTDAAQKDLIGSPSPTARQNYVTAKLAQAFPHSFVEVLAFPASYKNSGGQEMVGAYPAYVKYLNNLGINSTNCMNFSAADGTPFFPADVQQGVCLMMILETGPFPQGVNRDDLLRTSAAARITLPTGSGAVACVDAWGSRILYTRNSLGQANTPVLMSMGRDLNAGVQVFLRDPNPSTAPDPLKHTLAKTSIDATDNVISGVPDDPWR